MPEPLTLEHFEKFEIHFDETMTTIADTLDGQTKRLDRIESILWDGARLAEMERRLIKLAEIVGAADLATPITRPIAS